MKFAYGGSYIAQSMTGIGGVVFRSREARLTQGDREAILKGFSTGESQGCDSAVYDLGQGMFAVVGGVGRMTGIVHITVQGREVALVFQGTIYNRKAIIPAQENSEWLDGLLRLYLKEKLNFLARIRGEFTLALWDGRSETLYLSTDRFRVHPLFYTQLDGNLIFASSLKALASSSLLRQRTINPEAIVDVVGSSVIPTPKTIFLEVNKLAPGHILTYNKGTVQTASYWDIDFRNPSASNESTLIDQLKNDFRASISIRLESDDASDRVGTFLSGGLDSSAVTGVLTQVLKRSVKSFSIGFADEQFNEMNYARIAARHFAAKHYEYFVTPSDVVSAMPVLLDAFDEPFANASAVPTYYCAKLAREHGVEILYAGDGGDELFAGNERYATQRLFDYYQMVTPWLRDLVLTPLIFKLAAVIRWNILLKARRYIKRSNIPYPERLYSYGFLQNIALPDWFEDGVISALEDNFRPYAEISSHYSGAKAHDELDRQLYVDLKLTISDNDIIKVTRMTEAAGIGVRYPFLDHELAEFAATIPASLKMKGTHLRSFFKKAYSDLLPQEILSKKKHGFGLPIPVWLRTDKQLNEMMHDLVLSPRSVQRGYFRKRGLEDLIAWHKADKTTSFYGTILWNLMYLELWHRRYIDLR